MSIRFVRGDNKVMEFQLLTISQDPPHVPEPIDISVYDSIILYATQEGPRPQDPSTFVPKTFTIVGTKVAPFSLGYVSFAFTSAILNTSGKYLCRIKVIKTGTEIWSNKHDFYIYVRD